MPIFLYNRGYQIIMKDYFKDFTEDELSLIKSLDTPHKIQSFINSLEINFEEERETCYSPKTVLNLRKAHCMEGSMLAACILRYHGYQPLLVDIEATKDDFDHVIAVFKINGFYGAISKTNHSVLRYREPIYKSIRELAMSFFHEYFTDSGVKTMRTYSDPVNLKQFDGKNWMTSEKDIWFIPNYLTKIPHKSILTKKQIENLRKADEIEIQAGKLTEYNK